MEMKELPKSAGDAILHFVPNLPDNWAIRKDKEILLTHDAEARFYPLKKGSQFLYTCGDGTARFLYFGGMDESPFLVELDLAVFEHLLDGEEAFFDSLKPAWIRNAERETKRKALRQGDFFAWTSSKDMSTFLRTHMQRGNRAEVQIVEKMQLRETRHRFSGLYFNVRNNDGHFLSAGGEGVIEAPDHAPLKLEGPHIIMQALHLVKPKEAD
jgi:hypothetical protein